jgi:hypothetical protein
VKYVLSLVFGLVFGVAVAAVLIYFNPLTLGQSDRLANAQWVLDYQLGGGNIWLSTHDDRLEIPVVPIEAPLLWEGAIKGTILTAMPLAGSSGSASAVATRISVPSSKSEFLRSGLLVEDHWLITVPGSGTMFVHGINNHWPLVRDTLVTVDWLGRDFRGPETYEPTLGPVGSHAEVFGLTGEFENARGRGHESVSLDSYEGNLAALSGQLMIEMSEAGG